MVSNLTNTNKSTKRTITAHLDSSKYIDKVIWLKPVFAIVSEWVIVVQHQVSNFSTLPWPDDDDVGFVLNQRLTHWKHVALLQHIIQIPVFALYTPTVGSSKCQIYKLCFDSTGTRPHNLPHSMWTSYVNITPTVR